MTAARTAAAVLLFYGACAAPAARADLGPENAVLVVNGDSFAAVTVANRYAAVRGLPASHVVVLRDLPSWERLNLANFRDLVLRPTLEAVNARGIAGHTDLVLYSPAVPTAIDLGAEVRSLDPKPNKVFTPTGSLTGLTTLFQPVLAVGNGAAAGEDLTANATRAILSPAANPYFAGVVGDGEAPATVGFRSARGYGPGGETLDEPGAGRRFLLASALGVTTGAGETVGEVLDRTEAVAAADGTGPAGAVVFTRTGDVRTTARSPRFAAAARATNAAAEDRGLPVYAAVRDAALPPGIGSVVGLTCGVARADWRKSRSAFAPGAFADNLTSFGGVLTKPTTQTTVADWLRAGASAAGGTVTEPYAVPFKFPAPFVHAHRLRGATLAEAVGLSVAGPYQYLLVGDGLSNPYANRPDVSWDPTGAAVGGTLTLRPTAAVPAGAELAGWEAFAGGVRVAAAAPGRPLRLNTRRLTDGVHEVAVVATLAGPVESRGRAVRAVRVENAGRQVAARVDGAGGVRTGGPATVAWGEPLRVRVAAAGFGGAKTVRAELRRGAETFAAADLPAVGKGFAGVLTVDTRPLGLGPVELVPRVIGGGENGLGAAVRVEVTAPPDRPASLPAGVRTAPGPRLAIADTNRTLAKGLPRGWMKGEELPAGAAFTLTAVVNVKDAGLHRLAVRSNCGVRVAAGGEPAAWFRDATDATRAGKAWRSVPLWLAAGRHELTLTGTTPEKGTPVLDALWGRRGQVAPTANAWRHRD